MLTQVLSNLIVSASITLLFAASFAVVYKTTRFFHFAHGIVFTFGAYGVFFFSSLLGLPFGGAVLLSVLSCVIGGCMMEAFLYRPLRRKGSSPLVMLLASLGLYIILQNVTSICFGDDTKIIAPDWARMGASLFGARLTVAQILTVVCSWGLIAGLTLYLKKSKAGKKLRAVSSDPLLAEVSGIDSLRVILLAFALGSGLAAASGILYAIDLDATPTMGMNALMMAVVVVIVGGSGNLRGLFFAAFLLCGLQQVSVWLFSPQWQDATALVVLLIVLLIRSAGNNASVAARARAE